MFSHFVFRQEIVVCCTLYFCIVERFLYGLYEISLVKEKELLKKETNVSIYYYKIYENVEKRKEEKGKYCIY